jgi:hypothetical protein
MLTPVCYDNGTPGIYGGGLVRQRYRGVETIGHAGGVVGGRSEVLTVPSHQLDLVVLVNRSDLSAIQLARRVLDVVLADALAPLRPADKDADGWAGEYYTPRTRQFFRLTAPDGRVMLDLGSGGEEVERDGGTLRFARTDIGVIELRAQSENAIEFVHCGNAEPAVRVKLVHESAGGDDLVGDHCSEEAAAAAKIERRDDGQLTIAFRGLHGSAGGRLTRIADDAWLVTPEDAAITTWMVLTWCGSGFFITTTRTWNLWFGRGTSREAAPLPADSVQPACLAAVS